MKTMPIREKLTLWYCFIFGLLLVTITSTIYVVHRTAHYKDLDKTLNTVSTHIQDELEREIRDGKSLNQAHITFDEFVLNGVYIVIKDSNGRNVRTNVDSLPLPDNAFAITNNMNESLHTFSDPTMGRFRMLIAPIRSNDHIVGYIESVIALQQLDISLNRFAWLIIGITGLGLIIAAICGRFLAKKVLYRVELISLTAQAISSSQGFHQRVLHAGPRDELGKLVETFNEMLESLEKAYISQKQFIADASHELRAPLTTIRGNLDILQKVKNIPPEEQEEILRDTRNEAIRMSKMVADLLSLARADAGQEIQMQVVDLSRILKDIHMEIRKWNKNVILDFHSDPSVTTWGNTDLLKQLLLILIENGIKYTPEGGKVSCVAFEDGQEVLVRISDTGIGIQSQDLPHIFDRFYRSQEARIQSPEGTGLGLSIAKWIVNQHNGTITVTSSPGKGSEFLVHLPRINHSQTCDPLS